ncbi:3-hydroxyacyl-CoA dehydrogenase NAD-binding domain-containing protein [Ahrensia sp. R2A130]|uniref:3-hydroxyacyl-CoA dehydrogenase NAD-binding domain-containing protein n=1 Tax=Ahrensia sp. R2A130 TaxID=744979 RepID=UPI0001E0CA2C|nr:3-hydroxyacyl-CoA dehydrogenase NAD-binding domain-containing protein [Ahrensia sp. R2A130]EFL87870.1 fatty acid oxidation complex subunit alpha [Ahrensia sp. R2A130]
MKNFAIETDADGIATITWDMPGKSMNVIDITVMDEFEKLVAEIEADEEIKGVVLTSGKSTFGAGADLTMLQDMLAKFEAEKARDADAAMQMLFDNAYRLNLLLRRVEAGDKPWVAAINGTALGGCFEMALACHGRVMSEDEKATVGLPEVKVGLLPGGGGTQRVARLVNPQDAVTMLLQGKAHRAAKAKQLGLVHEVVPAGDVIAKAKEMLKGGLKPKAPWDERGFRAPLNIWSPDGMQMLAAGNAIMRKETYANYPNATNIMKCVYEGMQVPFDTALKIESRYFANTIQSPEAAAMIRSLFINMQELNKGARRPDVPKRELNKIGVIGAGFMGAGIAYVTAKAGMEVVLIDRDQDAADKGKDWSRETLDKAIKRKHSTEEKRDALLAKIEATTDYGKLSDCDLVIEAVFEDKGVKADVTKQVDAASSGTMIFASNTSTIPIGELAEASKNADNFIGIHFFSPVDKMMLVEIIMAEKTGDDALALAIDYVTKIKKTPIVVNDTRGFYVNRAVIRYMQEAWSMLIEGVPVPMIDNLARAAGMPVGPLTLNDAVALDLSQKVMKQTLADLGEEEALKVLDKRHIDLIDTMVEHGRVGKKAGKGWYDYNPKPVGAKLWPDLKTIHTQQDADAIDHQEIEDRFLYTIALEAVRCFEEGVVTDIREADVGAILGFGFAPFTGGPLSFIDGIGVEAFTARANDLASRHGEHFSPPALLVEMAKNGETFYGRFSHEEQKQAA